jgi:hypothetical protein
MWASVFLLCELASLVAGVSHTALDYYTPSYTFG